MAAKVLSPTSTLTQTIVVDKGHLKIVMKSCRDVTFFMQKLSPKLREQPHWREIKTYLKGKKPTTRAFITRLIERALKRDGLVKDSVSYASAKTAPPET